MSSKEVHLIKHRLKGTLLQLDSAFELMEEMMVTNPAEADEIRQSIIKNLTLSIQALEAIAINTQN